MTTSRRFERLQVITGPITLSALWITCLTASVLWKCPGVLQNYRCAHDEAPLALAFIMPQDVRGNEPLDDYLVTIDDIEAQTGLNFSRLNPHHGSRAEGELAQGWALEEIARRPGRYQ